MPTRNIKAHSRRKTVLCRTHYYGCSSKTRHVSSSKSNQTGRYIGPRQMDFRRPTRPHVASQTNYVRRRRQVRLTWTNLTCIVHTAHYHNMLSFKHTHSLNRVIIQTRINTLTTMHEHSHKHHARTHTHSKTNTCTHALEKMLIKTMNHICC